MPEKPLSKSICDCSSDQRNHPAHEAVHEALDEALANGIISFVGLNEHGKAVYRSHIYKG